MDEIKFIDLFSGIGGFHQSMKKYGIIENVKTTCILSSEIDKYAIEIYKENYDISSDVNVRDIDVNSLEDFDVLCAGFPCQTFSKAGKQEGFNDETKGTLFFDIERILNAKHPKYIVLENVRNLVSHDKGRTWETIKSHLNASGYRLTNKPIILSPHHFGIPQLRERVVILGKYDPDRVNEYLDIKFDDLMQKDDNSIYDVIEDKDIDSLHITAYEEEVLSAWDEFYQNINIKIIGFPVWVEYFKKSENDDFPSWKNEFIRKNNKLYNDNKEFIDEWLSKNNNLLHWVPTHRKFEWQCGTKINSIWEGVIQIRPSGIRVKTPTCFPALVAMVQIPIIGKLKRRLSVREAARLQSFPDNFIPHTNNQQAYKQFGNAVNVEVIYRCMDKLFKYKD